ncbi:hypothetical protein [Nakamurella endophytica]|uniref:Uncharacterized protein n=1 Tax=Nakamurella endophytica TaxID=1748367 RepID=A0A917T7N8_9ACTN|nr:hypothetical protein [Nakamurella endophytica]GGM12937.1 hypothetical protein GCM10011594_36070 [Nakamurella endophytica]
MTTFRARITVDLDVEDDRRLVRSMAEQSAARGRADGARAQLVEPARAARLLLSYLLTFGLLPSLADRGVTGQVVAVEVDRTDATGMDRSSDEQTRGAPEPPGRLNGPSARPW